MTEGPRAPRLRAVPDGTMGETIPRPSQVPAAPESADDPHESVTIAPPAPNFDELLKEAAPSLTNQSDQHFRAALDAGSRAGSSLGQLSKIVAELSNGLAGAKHANEQLVQELTTLRAMLGAANEQQVALKHQAALLEQELASSRSEAERERQLLTEQNDTFLYALLEEYEETLQARADLDDTARMSNDVGDLIQKLVETESARGAAEQACVQARQAQTAAENQRDEALARADRRERERDELRAEASQLRARLGTLRNPSSTPPPPLASGRPPSFGATPALRLDAADLDTTLHARGSSPRLPSVRPRLTSPPAELERAVYAPHTTRAPSAPAASDPSHGAPTVEPFPRESTRPGVGGPKPSAPPSPPSFAPPPSGWTPPPPALEPAKATGAASMSAASLPPDLTSQPPLLKQKPDPTTRPLTDYSLRDGVLSETLEGARLNSQPPRK